MNNEYLQAVLDYYDFKLAKLDKKTRCKKPNKEDKDVYDFYRGRRQLVFSILNETFFNDSGKYGFGHIPEEFRRNKNGDLAHERRNPND